MDASIQYLWNINFISEIEKRPGIWNGSLKSRTLQKTLWEELSQLYKKPVDSLKRKFGNLKDKFRQQLSMIPQTDNNYDIDPKSFESDWLYYRQMMFLINENETKSNQKRKLTSIEPNNAAKRKRDEDVVIGASENDGSDASSENDQVKQETVTLVEVKPDILPNSPPNDGLFHFLMSLYDCMSGLDPIRKINVQARIYSILSQEVAEAATN